MRVVKLAARFLCTACILIVGFYTVISIAIAFFIATGTLTPGEVMFYDSHTPTLSQTLIFIGGGSIIVGGLALARHKLSGDSPK